MRKMHRPGAGSGLPNLNGLRRLVAQDHRATSESVHQTARRFVSGQFEVVWFQSISAGH